MHLNRGTRPNRFLRRLLILPYDVSEPLRILHPPIRVIYWDENFPFCCAENSSNARPANSCLPWTLLGRFRDECVNVPTARRARQDPWLCEASRLPGARPTRCPASHTWSRVRAAVGPVGSWFACSGLRHHASTAFLNFRYHSTPPGGLALLQRSAGFRRSLPVLPVTNLHWMNAPF